MEQINPTPTAPAPWAPVPTGDLIRVLEQAGFSAESYLDAYPDVAQVGTSAAAVILHYLLFGLPERRVVSFELNAKALLTLAGMPFADADYKARLLAGLSAGLFKDVDHLAGPAIVSDWPLVRGLIAHGARPYFLAGDSHSNQFRQAGVRGESWLLPIHMLCTGGSAGGLGNPVARSGYGGRVRQAVQFIEILFPIETVPLLIQFGQVDLEFVHHFQRARDGRQTLNLEDYRAFCRQTADRYIRFLTSLATRLRIVVVSLFPPALSDEAWRQGHVNDDILGRETNVPQSEMAEALRGLRIASLPRRTEMHRYFNDLLRTACERHGFGYIDCMTPFLGADGTVDPRFVVPEAGGTEHHLDDRRTGTEISRLIWQAIDRATAGSH